MQIHCESKDKVEYIAYENLPQPEMKQISDHSIEYGFLSEEWVIQFQTITKLRGANKHYSMVFLNQLLTKYYKKIIGQVDNLRSNNSKQALTLLTEIFAYQNLNNLNSQIMRSIVSTLFTKSVSEKGFIKAQALKAINLIPNISNPSILEELMILTKSNNGNISELSIKIMNQMLQKNSITNVDQRFLKDLSSNINGKRAIVQKQAKEILFNLKKRMGEGKLEELIDGSSELDPEQSNTLKRQLKKNPEDSKSSKSNDFKEFMRLKKQHSNSNSNSNI